MILLGIFDWYFDVLVTKVLERIPIEDDVTKVCLVTFQLKAPAELWWESMKNTRVGVAMG